VDFSSSGCRLASPGGFLEVRLNLLFSVSVDGGIIRKRMNHVKCRLNVEYNAKVLMTFAPTLPLDDNPAAWNGGLSSALSTPTVLRYIHLSKGTNTSVPLLLGVQLFLQSAETMQSPNPRENLVVYQQDGNARRAYNYYRRRRDHRQLLVSL
jgi:hypothetical protein